MFRFLPKPVRVDRFYYKSQIWKLTKIHWVRVAAIHEDGHTHMAKLVVPFRYSFATAPVHVSAISHTILMLNKYYNKTNTYMLDLIFVTDWLSYFTRLGFRRGPRVQESVCNNEFPANLFYIRTVPNSEISDVNRRCSCYLKRSVPVKSHPILLFLVNDACNTRNIQPHCMQSARVPRILSATPVQLYRQSYHVFRYCLKHMSTTRPNMNYFAKSEVYETTRVVVVLQWSSNTSKIRSSYSFI
jgi:hypothetical protein